MIHLHSILNVSSDGFVLNALPERPIKYVRGTGEQASAVLNYYHFCDSNYSSPDYKCEVDNERLAKNGFTVQFAGKLFWSLKLTFSQCTSTY